MVQLWRVCAVFFCFLACPLHSITQKSIEHRIGCNCGAFAPYFFVFPGLVLDGCKIGCNCGAFAPYFFDACWISFLIHIMLFLGKVQFGRIVLDRLNSHTVSRLRAAKGLSQSAARSFAALRMTGLDLAGAEELSRAFEPCLTLLISIAEHPAKADKSAVCAINRHLRVSGVFS